MKFDVSTMYAELPDTYLANAEALVAVASAADDDDGAMPFEVRNWLVHLRLLEGVPFANLIADTDLLPAESIRWFYLDRQWTDALVQGALSVSTVNSDDRTHLSGVYGAVRDELDIEERNVRRRPGSARFAGKVDAISGFVLRSAAVAGWPGLHVRGFSTEPAEGDLAQYSESDPRRMRVLRLERLAPAVLLVLFDGIPEVVHIEEPRQGVQFGFDHSDTGAGRKVTLKPRDVATFKDLPVAPVPVGFRSSGAPGVVDIQRLERDLAPIGATGPDPVLDAAEYALQLIRFPYRQVFGDVADFALIESFKATLSYSTLAATFVEQP